MDMSDFLETLGPPTYIEEQSGETIWWTKDDEQIKPPDIKLVNRDSTSPLSMALKYVFYTYEIEGQEYVAIGMGGYEEGGRMGYWPKKIIYQQEEKEND